MGERVSPDRGRGLDGDVDRYLSDVDRLLQPYLEQAVERIPEVESFKEGVSYQVLGGGKRIRAALCTTACEIFCGSYQHALGFAAAIEHLQNFSLIHDDIADGDGERARRAGTAVPARVIGEGGDILAAERRLTLRQVDQLAIGQRGGRHDPFDALLHLLEMDRALGRNDDQSRRVKHTPENRHCPLPLCPARP